MSKERIKSCDIVFDCSSEEPGATETVVIVGPGEKIRSFDVREELDVVEVKLDYPRHLFVSGSVDSVPAVDGDRRFLIVEERVLDVPDGWGDVVDQIADSVPTDGRAGRREPFYRQLERKGRRRW